LISSVSRPQRPLISVCNPSEYIYTLRSDQERLRKMKHKVIW
jgi:hypothetical protein